MAIRSFLVRGDVHDFAYRLQHQHTYLEAQIMSLRLRSDSGDDKGSPSAETPTISGTSRAPLVEKLIDTVVGGSNEIPFKYVLPCFPGVSQLRFGAYSYACCHDLQSQLVYERRWLLLGRHLLLQRSLMPKLGQYEALNTRYGVAGNDCH